jgi:hypothetical protein
MIESRVPIISALHVNMQPNDKKMLEQGYIPIHWLLAKVDYYEATYIKQMDQVGKIERMMVRR